MKDFVLTGEGWESKTPVQILEEVNDVFKTKGCVEFNDFPKLIKILLYCYLKLDQPMAVEGVEVRDTVLTFLEKYSIGSVRGNKARIVPFRGRENN